ncbi:hypothetical protein KKA03_02260 [archaeon]|nr:hypothetical protein [archaeon]
MKAWKKGAILGFFWAISGYILAFSEFEPLFYNRHGVYIGGLLFIPTLIAFMLGFRSYMFFFAFPTIGIVIGAILGYLYGRWKEK